MNQRFLIRALQCSFAISALLAGTQPARAQTWVQWTSAAGGNNHFYALTPSATNWVAAQKLAVSWGGTLATITSSNEQNFINTTFLRGAFEHLPLWIGLSSSPQKGMFSGKLGPVHVQIGTPKVTFQWVTHEPFAYSNWKEGEPSDTPPGENYVAMNWGYSDAPPRGLKGDWNDTPLNGTTGYGGKTDGPYFGLVERQSDPDAVDYLITNRMREHHITGLSLAIIQHGKIVKAKGFGFTDKSCQTPVTPGTLFQAGSISKAVAALGALRLVQEGRVSLDNDVNSYLHSWKVPENEFTKEQKVTLRRILSHTAGLTVHGFPGYRTNDLVPTLLEVLEGAKPANNPAIRVDLVPGSKWRYSGGGYTVMQQMIIDVTGKPFPQFMSDTVLKPLVMMDSTYEQPLPLRMAGSAAAGYLENGNAVMGGWRVQPEMAAAGLWTTPSDLARFALGIQQALAGDSNAVLSQAATRLMLADEKDGDGLGVFVDGSGQALRFSHGGRNAGFDSFMIAYASVGKGAVIMMNANDSGTSRAIVDAIAKEYGWSRGVPLIPAPWKRDEFVNAHPNVVRSAAIMLCALAFFVVVACRKLLKRYWKGR